MALEVCRLAQKRGTPRPDRHTISMLRAYCMLFQMLRLSLGVNLAWVGNSNRGAHFPDAPFPFQFSP